MSYGASILPSVTFINLSINQSLISHLDCYKNGCSAQTQWPDTVYCPTVPIRSMTHGCLRRVKHYNTTGNSYRYVRGGDARKRVELAVLPLAVDLERRVGEPGVAEHSTLQLPGNCQHPS